MLIYCILQFCVTRLLQVNGKITTIRAAGGYFSVQPSSRRNVSKKEFPLDKKLADLRKEFEKNADYKGLDAYIVPSEDPHQVNHSSRFEAEFWFKLLAFKK